MRKRAITIIIFGCCLLLFSCDEDMELQGMFGENNDSDSLPDYGYGGCPILIFDDFIAEQPVWDSSGESIVFLGSGPYYDKLWTIDPEGGNLTLLLSGDDFDLPSYIPPADYSNNGYLLFYAYDDPYYSEIYYLPPDGGEPVFVCQGASPTVKGNLYGIYNIAYIYEELGKYYGDGIYLTDINGSAPQLVIADEGVWYPDWSPDGTKLVYTRWITTDESWDSQLCIFDLNAQSETIIHEATGAIRCPRWSPDGRWIAFTEYYLHEGETHSKEELFIISPLGGEPIRLTDFPYDPGMVTYGVRMLSWSPDSEWIVYDLMGMELWKVRVVY